MRYLFALGLLLVGACELETLGYSSWEFFDESQSIRTGEDVRAVRVDMIELVFGESMPTRLPDEVELIRDSAFPGHLIERMTVHTDDLFSVAYLIHPEVWNGALAIYHQGHRGDFRSLGNDTITALLDEGFRAASADICMIHVRNCDTPVSKEEIALPCPSSPS